MKNLFLLPVVFLLCSGCSEQESKDETLGKEISSRMNAPIEKARAVTDKIKVSRQTGLPE